GHRARAALPASATSPGRSARSSPAAALLLPAATPCRTTPAAVAGHARDLRALLRRGSGRPVRRLLRHRSAARGVQPDGELRCAGRRRGTASSPAARGRGVTVKRALAVVALVLALGPASSADAQRGFSHHGGGHGFGGHGFGGHRPFFHGRSHVFIDGGFFFDPFFPYYYPYPYYAPYPYPYPPPDDEGWGEPPPEAGSEPRAENTPPSREEAEPASYGLV